MAIFGLFPSEVSAGMAISFGVCVVNAPGTVATRRAGNRVDQMNFFIQSS
jgi:hypothetical protein